MIDDGAILSRLDDTWRSVTVIKAMLGGGDAYELALALSRLDAARMVECTEKPLGIPKRLRGGKVGEMTLLLYRRSAERS